MRNLDTGREVTRFSDPGFSTTRLLVGDFRQAQKVIKSLVKDLSPVFAFSKKIVIHQLDKMEGGVSPVEARVLRELALDAGGFLSFSTLLLRTAICTKENALSDQEIFNFWKARIQDELSKSFKLSTSNEHKASDFFEK
ncbi:MAG: hypothetical protein FWC38_01955 [Proteobacteria bacterium]|nr:hypothetical protein [Pseudomonadota bacterium]MCL2307005.1 hypothetical protein [Pseudomonadota bacterium]